MYIGLKDTKKSVQNSTIILYNVELIIYKNPVFLVELNTHDQL